MSAASKVCSMCLRPTEECGIVAGNVMEVYICGSCAEHVLETIQLKEEERAAAAEAPATLEGQVLDALKRSEDFILDGLNHGFIDAPKLNDREREILPILRDVISKMREAIAA